MCLVFKKGVNEDINQKSYTRVFLVVPGLKPFGVKSSHRNKSVKVYKVVWFANFLYLVCCLRFNLIRLGL